jgi:glycopeptide antibiotics resistance protein
MEKEKLFKRLSIVVFIVYLLLVVWVAILKCNIIENVKYSYYFLSELTLKERVLREINPIGWYIDPPIKSQVPFYLRDDLLNVALFVPFGLYLAYFFKNKKILKILITAFLFSLSIELFQLFTLLGGGSSKDIITNTLGALIGGVIFSKIYSPSRIKVLNICSIILLIVVLPLFAYATINTIMNIEIYVGVLLRTL